MSEKIPQFDFSKIEDQEKFDASSEDVKDTTISQSRLEAKFINKLIHDGRAKNYEEAVRMADDFIFDAFMKNLHNQEEIDFPVSRETMERIALRGLRSCLTDWSIEGAIKIKNTFSISPEKLSSQEIKEDIFQKLEQSLIRGNIKFALKIKKEFPVFTEEEILKKTEEAAYEGVKLYLEKGLFHENIALIKENFFISPEKLKELSLLGLKSSLSENNIEHALKIKNFFPFTEENLKEVAYNIFIENLSQEETESAFEKIKQVSSVVGIASLTDVFPEINDKKEQIKDYLNSNKNVQKEKWNVFLKVAERSFSVQIFLYKNSIKDIIETVERAPFLLDAIVNNETFGSRLFAVYNNFDGISKEKIAVLFKFQEEILAQNPDIKKDSVEFRMAMQERLRSYDKNHEIISEIEENKINVEAWLEHDVKEEILLGGKDLEEISVSQFIERPFNRIIGETIPEYIKIVREELAPYKKDLEMIRVSDGKALEAQEKLIQMKKLLSETEDEKKKAGIEKGIVSIEKGLVNAKTIPYMDKLKGAIFGLESMMKSVEMKKEEIKVYEQEKKYQKINELKKKLYLDYKTLCTRFDGFQKDLQKIEEYFGGHGQAIMQAVNHQTAEMLSHFATDNNDIKKVFENTDLDEQIKKSKVVSLELWNRNPYMDLYLGNYSPCCISIEGGSGGSSSESAIADYMTDVSIQVLNLMDKEKNIPIMSAWLYLGKNQEGETAIIIDNIESDASQTDLYHDEIWEKVKEYVIAYAQKIGVKKVSMGSYNNDVEPKESYVDYGEYKKIGPVNGDRHDGYYLESEEEKFLYLIWNESGNTEYEEDPMGYY